MTTNPVRNRRRRTAALALVTATLVPGLAQLPALASSTSAAPTPLSADDVTTLGDSVPGLSDLDVRGSVRLHVDDTASWALAVGLSDVAELSDAECARLRDGRVVCWGEDERYAEDVLVDMPAEEPDGEGAADAAGGEATPIERTDAADDEGSMLPVCDF